MKRKPEKELALLFRALAFAAHKHRDQRRKDAEASPYINHPIALAEVLAGEGGVADVEVLAAALLHDTIEDTATTADRMNQRSDSGIAPRFARAVQIALAAPAKPFRIHVRTIVPAALAFRMRAGRDVDLNWRTFRFTHRRP